MSVLLRCLLILNVIWMCPLVGRAADGVEFSKDILPLFAEKCFRCHGPDENTRESDLRLDQFENATAKLESGSIPIVPGKHLESEVWNRVSTDDEDLRMPPQVAGTALNEKELAALQSWIDGGAKYDRHWSFAAPTVPPFPQVSKRHAKWSRNAIDRFVLARLELEQLQPNVEADRFRLIRRVTLDLTGLPPSLEDVDAFVNDKSQGAYERLVDRLLASPAYGERWARVWLDIARYADSAGYAQDPDRTIWRYRDWVIDAFNKNKPFDQFTIEQIAGDMLPNPTDDQILATAFHRNTLTNSEGGTDDEEFRNAAIIDRVNTTMQVWMGVTMGCAQCHTHKYDPITQEEYFQFFAVFNQSEDADRGDEHPLLTEYQPDAQARRAQLQEQIDELQQGINSDSKDETLQKKLKELKDQLAKVPAFTTPIMRELPAEKYRKTHIQIRGNHKITGKQVKAAVPAAFHALADGEANRLTVAKWLVDSQNPLTARVVVNRFWENLFGLGIVETSEDFGIQGDPPSHPQLLDYLATELTRSVWDTKELVRLIVTSSTYRQSSQVDSELAQLDPRNRLLARGPRYRLAAETLRDQALELSGLLSGKMFGPSVRPVRPNLGLRSAFGGSTDWKTSEGENRYRRGLYTSWRRTTPYPSMTTFDAPSREVCSVRRIRTNTPLQALVTLNDPVFVEAAQGLARRVLLECDGDQRDRMRHAFRICVARPPTAQEIDRLVKLFEQTHAQFSASPDDAKKIATDPRGPAPKEIDIVELGTWTMISNVLLNLDEVIARP